MDERKKKDLEFLHLEILKLNKTEVKRDPFTPKLDKVIYTYIKHVDGLAQENVNLAEEGYLLEGVLHIHSAQVTNIYKMIQDMRNKIMLKKEAEVLNKKSKREANKDPISTKENVSNCAEKEHDLIAHYKLKALSIVLERVQVPEIETEKQMAFEPVLINVTISEPETMLVQNESELLSVSDPETIICDNQMGQMEVSDNNCGDVLQNNDPCETTQEEGPLENGTASAANPFNDVIGDLTEGIIMIPSVENSQEIVPFVPIILTRHQSNNVTMIGPKLYFEPISSKRKYYNASRSKYANKLKTEGERPKIKIQRIEFEKETELQLNDSLDSLCDQDDYMAEGTENDMFWGEDMIQICQAMIRKTAKDCEDLMEWNDSMKMLNAKEFKKRMKANVKIIVEKFLETMKFLRSSEDIQKICDANLKRFEEFIEEQEAMTKEFDFPKYAKMIVTNLHNERCRILNENLSCPNPNWTGYENDDEVSLSPASTFMDSGVFSGVPRPTGSVVSLPYTPNNLDTSEPCMDSGWSDYNSQSSMATPDQNINFSQKRISPFPPVKLSQNINHEISTFVPLVTVFENIKEVTASEFARNFSALLQKLSDKTIVIDYDKLHSPIMEKQLSNTSNIHKMNDSEKKKFQDEMKKLASICPSLKLDDESKNQIVVMLSSDNNLESDNNISTRNVLHGIEISNGEKGLQENLNDFVEDNGENYGGSVQPKRKTPKNKSDKISERLTTPCRNKRQSLYHENFSEESDTENKGTKATTNLTKQLNSTNVSRLSSEFRSKRQRLVVLEPRRKLFYDDEE